MGLIRITYTFTRIDNSIPSDALSQLAMRALIEASGPPLVQGWAMLETIGGDLLARELTVEMENYELANFRNRLRTTSRNLGITPLVELELLRDEGSSS